MGAKQDRDGNEAYGEAGERWGGGQDPAEGEREAYLGGCKEWCLGLVPGRGARRSPVSLWGGLGNKLTGGRARVQG